MINPAINIREATAYAPELGFGIGLLIPDLVETDDGSPASEDLLREIIESERSALFVAQTQDDLYVGTATVNLVPHPRKRIARLDYLIVSSAPEIRGSGVGHRLYRAAGAWALQKGASRMDWDTLSAQQFYLRQGAVMQTYTPFQRTLSPADFSSEE